MGLLSIHGVTVSVDFSEKNYGSGNGRFLSASSKVPGDSEGIPLDKADEVMSDGVELYFTAWQTLMQTRFATGEITGSDYKRQTAAFMVRIERIQALYKKIRGKSIEELEEFLKREEEGNVSNQRPEQSEG
jgi:hypothetical protein